MATQQWEASPFYSAWTQALKEYKSYLPEEDKIDLEDSKWQRINNYDDLVSSMDRDHDNFKAELSRGSMFTGALKGFCTGLSTLMDLFGGAASAAFPPCSQILGAVSVLIGAGKRVTGAFDAVDGLFQRLAEFVGRLKPLTAHKLDSALEQIVVGLLVSLLRICALATHKICYDEEKEPSRHKHLGWHRGLRSAKSKTKEYFIQLFTGDDKEINDAVAEVERLVEAENRMTVALIKQDTSEILFETEQVKTVAVDIQGLSLTIRDVTYDIKRDTEEIKFHVTATEEGVGQIRTTMMTKADYAAGQAETKAMQTRQLAEQSVSNKLLSEMLVGLRSPSGRLNATKSGNPDIAKAKKHADLLKNLLKPPTANEAVYQKAKAERKAVGTGNWILEEPLLKQWFAREIAILVVAGGRGTGKTFLATRIVEELETRFDSANRDLSSSYAYFFCKRNPTQLSSIPSMLKSLASQICELDKVYTTYLDTPARRNRVQSGDFEELWKVLFQDFFQESNRSTVLVIDGLNETEERDLNNFLQALKTASISESGWQLRNVQFLFLVGSDSVEKLKGAFGDSVPALELDNANKEADLKAFVQGKLERNWKQSLISKELREEVETSLLARCQGNFLWLSFVLESVLSRNREDGIRALLRDLPKDVQMAMLLILDRLSGRLDREDVEDLSVSCRRYAAVSSKVYLLTYCCRM
jgi:hypothetical protein